MNTPSAIFWWLVLPAVGIAALIWIASGRRQRRDTGLCVCRHPKNTHEHFRGGTDCARCACPSWLPVMKLRTREIPDDLDPHFATLPPLGDDLDDELTELLRGETA